MATKQFTIILMNKRYSSWSLRGWLALRFVVGADGFDELLFNLAGEGLPSSNMLPRAEISKYSPSGKAPALIDHDLNVTIYESLAIILHIADRFPASGLLPTDPAARALCLSACAEMHAGFSGIRSNMTFHCLTKAERHGKEALKLKAVQDDIRRLGQLWSELRLRFGSEGNSFLFGSFGAADCMYAPIAVRFMTYDPELTSLVEFPLAQEYVRNIYALDMVQEWVEAAKKEGPGSFLQGYECVSDSYNPQDFA